jgi:uncharacterized surface protein with fasciclin (FAS1) repeats
MTYNMKKLIFGAFIAFTALVSFSSCKDNTDGPTPETPKNIVDLAKADANLSILVDAVVHADLATTLSGTDKLTVFAPTNAAFTALLTALGKAKITDVDKNTVRAILLYHVTAGEVKSSAITTGYVSSLSPFGTTTSNMSIFAEKGTGVKVNGANVVTADVSASNGVVHVIDKVMTLPTVVNHALNNPNFSILVQALTRSDLGVDYVGLLNGTGPFTVFAPTNAAFAALLTELGVANLNAIPAATLNSVLQYHVVNGANVLSTQLTNGQQVTTFGGSKFTVNLTGGAKIKDANNRESNIIATNVQGVNGVVHAIDKVILP